MKKETEYTIVAAIIGIFILAATCTNKKMTRRFGGETNIELPKGQKLVEMTWKNDNLWILTEPMDSDYIPKTKTFYEDSSFGIMEGKITIKETK